MKKLAPSSRPRRFVSLAALALVVPAALAGCGSDSDDSAAAPTKAVAQVDAVADLVPSQIRDAGVLRVAVPDGSAPLASVNDSGDVEGMDPEIATALGGLMGLDVKLVPGSFDAQIPGLQSDKYDLAMGEYYVTAERLASVDFVTDWRDYSSFATAADSDFEPKAGTDLCGHPVGVLKGSAEEASITTLNDSCDDPMKISAFPDQSAGFLALSSGRVDAVVTGRGPLEAASKKSDAFKISGEYGGGPCATAVARTEYSDEMLKAVQAGIQELIDNGTYAEILKKWDTDYGALDTAEIYTKDSTPPDYA
jgi:polar amino acid transport system substrate-binding protein